MKNIRKVLVAIAFSDYAEGIFTFAADFVESTGAELMVASVINERDVESVRTISAMGYEVDGEHYIENVKREREQILQSITSHSDLARDRIRTIFMVGNPLDELLNLIEEEGR